MQYQAQTAANHLASAERGNFDARRGGTTALYSYMREDANEVLRKIYLSD